jgi:hypothetical protein
MKAWKTFKYPALALAIVAAFWTFVMLAQRQLRTSRNPATPPPRSAAVAPMNPSAAPESRQQGSETAAPSPAASTAVNPLSAEPTNAVQPMTPAGTGQETNLLAAPSAGLTSAQGSSGIFVNGHELTPRQVEELRGIYGYTAPPGRYWYDPRSGLFGAMGREAAGFMRPGHDFGPLSPNASSGNMGVFINGRQINMVEATYLRQLFGAVYQGRWWLDGTTGNLGMEGNPMPVANVFVALQQAQRGGGQGGSYGWHSNVTGAYGGSSGGCSYVSIPGSGTVTSGNCD